MEKSDLIYVAGHRGLVGSAIIRQLKKLGYSNLLTRTREELDLTNQSAVNNFFNLTRPSYVLLAAAKVGGIQANNLYPADFIYQNMMIECNVIHAAVISGVKRLLFLGSTCIYPKFAAQPIAENALLTDSLEQTNEPYAIAKIAGIKLCESYNRQHDTDFRSIMPTNLFGLGDNFDPENSHIIPGLIGRFHQAKINNHTEAAVWGTGEPRREFLYADDLADAAIFVLKLSKRKYERHTTPMLSHLNVGTGADITIREIAYKIKETVGFKGELVFDKNKPNGTMRKLTDVSKLRGLGWHHKTSLEEGLKLTYEWYLENVAS